MCVCVTVLCVCVCECCARAPAGDPAVACEDASRGGAGDGPGAALDLVVLTSQIWEDLEIYLKASLEVVVLQEEEMDQQRVLI